uniref:Uncharacterized protein n=1 Tax=Anguilla anguilla TaxID=7936 RepID=A0A0E9R4B5_ANGAN
MIVQGGSSSGTATASKGGSWACSVVAPVEMETTCASF